MKAALKPEYFINRELSWLEFNARVLEEAQDASTPLLDRVKFLSIFSSNLDEFFMVRVAGLREQAFGKGAPQDFNPDGLNSLAQLREISARTRLLVEAQYKCYAELLPELSREGIQIVDHAEVAKSTALGKFFSETVFPIVTPMAIDPSHPRPRYHNRGLYLAAKLKRRRGLGPKGLFAVVQLPQVLPRLVPVTDRGPHTFVMLEDLVAARMPALFGGFEVECSCAFRITRDSDLEVLEQESDDMLRMIEERLRKRRQADAVRLEISAEADSELYQTIQQHEQIRDGSQRTAAGYSEVYRIPGPIDLTGLMPLAQLPDLDHLHDPSFTPQTPAGLRRPGEDVFAAIARRDILLHHPFDDFTPVVDFIQAAAEDPDVLAIKQTLYRTSGDSPIVRALMQAAENGKHVTTMVEVKARFDEAANVDWARRMESAGVHVVYGFMDLKTHTKVAMIARREGDTIRRYVHLSTGNYNPKTAELYTDLGLFTCDTAVCDDVSALFNLLTGYSQGHNWSKLVVAPESLHAETMDLIEQQTARATKGKPARIVAKLNSLVDHRVIEALYRASQAGVPVDLIVRGICCLRPGIKGVSDNINVISIVDRFLEHSRIFVFGDGDNPKVFLSSADWMPRNFYRRVEVMFPIEAQPLKKRILREILPAYLKDNSRARILQSDGTYVRKRPQNGEASFRCQQELLLGPTVADAAMGGPGSNGDDAPPKRKRKRAKAK